MYGSVYKTATLEHPETGVIIPDWIDGTFTDIEENIAEIDKDYEVDGPIIRFTLDGEEVILTLND